jgi:hypothetical protein
MRNSNPILLVEDDNVDVMTVKRALKDLNIKTSWLAQPMAKRLWSI